jgi:hypothetical protein
MKKKIDVLVALATIQRQEAYQHLVNRYCEIGDLFEAYKQVTNDDKTSIRSFTMILNNIVNMGFIKERHLEIFKRKKWNANKSYVIEYYFNSTLRRSPRTAPNHHEIAHSSASTEAISVDTVMEIPCKQDKQDIQQTRNNKRKRVKTSLSPPSVGPHSTEKDEQVVHAIAPTTSPLDNPIATATVAPTTSPLDNPITTATAVTPDRITITRPSLSTNRYSSFNDNAQYFINVSLRLDFSIRPRPNLKPNATSEFIPILPPTTNKRAGENMKWMMVATVSDLGISKLCKKDKLTVCKAVAYLE